ncbi:hypothetical protein [Gottfriedia solisilvae]
MKKKLIYGMTILFAMLCIGLSTCQKIKKLFMLVKEIVDSYGGNQGLIK